MSLVTRELPCTPVIDGKPTMLEFTGTDCGPFFLHREVHDARADMFGEGSWCITHRATGFRVATGFKVKARARACAKELSLLGCWDFTDPAHVKSFDSDLMRKINTIRLPA